MRMEARPGDISLAFAIIVVIAALAVGFSGHLLACAVLLWGAAVLFGYGRWLDTSSPS